MTPGAADRLPSLAACGSLLAMAVGFALESVRAVTPALLWRPTPCQGWDLRMLLRHGCDSLAALHEGVASGCVQRTGPATCRDRSADPALAFRDQAGVLLTVSGQLARRDVLVGDRHLTTSLLAAAGAVEIAVHGWDISRSCGILRQIPHGLAADLLELTPLLISGADRGLLFAAAMNAGRAAGPGERLVAFLGRDPAHSGG